MRFNERYQLNETYGILTHSNFFELSRLSNLSRIIHFRHSTINSEAQNETTGSELEIIE